MDDKGDKSCTNSYKKQPCLLLFTLVTLSILYYLVDLIWILMMWLSAPAI